MLKNSLTLPLFRSVTFFKFCFELIMSLFRCSSGTDVNYVYSIFVKLSTLFLHFLKENVSFLKPPRKTKLVTPHVNKFINVSCFFFLLRLRAIHRKKG
jgi:hypothetical protein